MNLILRLHVYLALSNKEGNGEQDVNKTRKSEERGTGFQKKSVGCLQGGDKKGRRAVGVGNLHGSTDRAVPNPTTAGAMRYTKVASPHVPRCLASRPHHPL
jgi:hypothetical protein